jgi:tetratricopeptide (TPR) repeat protein
MTSVRAWLILALLAGASGCAANGARQSQTESALYGDYLIGRYADLRRSDADATTRYMSALRLAPHDETLLKGAVESALAAGDIARAQQAAQMAHKQGAESELARLTLAAIALRDGDYAAASSALAHMPAGVLDRTAAQMLSAWAVTGQGRLDEALDAMASGRADSVLTRMALGQSAILLDNAGETDQALAAYERAEKNGFRGSAVVLRHGALLERIGRTPDAAALYHSILSAGPDDPAARAALARLEAGVKPPLAPTIAEGAALGLFTLAGAVVGQIDVDFYLPYLTLAQMLDPELDAAWLVAGEAQRQIKKPGAARAALQHVALTSPWYEVAQARIALSYRDEDNTDEALAVAKALAERTGGRLARVTLADIQRGADQWKEAEAIYDGLIAENQPAKAADWSLYFARAACREELGRWSEAEADLKRALELAPDQPEALNFLGYSWVSKGINLSKGLALLQRAVSLSPDSGYIIDSLGWAQFQMGDFTTAVDTLESAVSLDPQDPTLNEHLGDAYWRVGRRIEARFQWTRALDQHPDKDEKPALEQKLKAGLPPALRSPR